MAAKSNSSSSGSYEVHIEGVDEVVARIGIVSERLNTSVASALNAGAKIVETSAKSKVKVKTGRLKDSIHTIPASPENLEAQVVASTGYACIFDCNTRVYTDDGRKGIGQIKKGDRVLTQTGEFKRVLATNRFSVKLKPELVTITAPYQKGSTHKLTVTTDHKVLAYRDGRNQWIRAGDLTLKDSLYTKIKSPRTKGTGRVNTCANCGKKYKARSAGKYFCSILCRGEFYQLNGHPNTGIRCTPETREKLSAAAIKRYQEHPELHANYLRNQRGFNTNIEREVEEWIKKSGKKYQKQHRIGNCYVDFYLPDERTIIEADGAFWHKDQEKDIARDEEIKSAAPETTIVHIHFYNKRYSQNLIPTPLEDVYYVACNPGVSSFVDPTVFKAIPILKLERWTYKDERKDTRGFLHDLYDLTIEDVHSFYANGILVSNSYIEKGTGPHVIVPTNAAVLHFQLSGDDVWAASVQHPGSAAAPFMEPALDENTEDIKASVMLALQMELLKL
jgi:very-short-patch-repair endonuclease